MIDNIRKWFILAILPLFILCVLGIFQIYRSLAQLSEKEILQSLDSAVYQTAVTLDAHAKSIEDSLQTLINDTRFLSSLNRSAEQDTLENQLDEIKQLRELILYTGTNRNIANIRIFMNDQKMLMREHINFFGFGIAPDTSEYEVLSQERLGFHWIGNHFVDTRYFQMECLTLGLLKQIPSRDSNPFMVLIDIPSRLFSDILQKNIFPDDMCLAICSDSGEIRLGDADEPLLTAILQEKNAQTTGFLRDENHFNWAYIVRPLSFENWKLVAYVPRNQMLSGQSNTRLMLILVLMGLLLFSFATLAFLSMLFYSFSIRRYIHTLRKSLDGTEDTHRIPTHRILFAIDRSIAHLLDANKRLTEEKLQSQLREREVTLQALQAQIKPHFLYNTLDSINWMAIRANAPEVSEAITNLADYFRVSLSKGRNILTLAEEAEIARKYLLLYKNRYEYDYDVIWELAPETLAFTLPKLTLQPIIENALQHGIFKRSDPEHGLIRITSILDDRTLILTVTDNGPGFKTDTTPSHGYGLTNVQKRLDLYCNQHYSFTSEKSPEGGAQITIRIWKD